MITENLEFEKESDTIINEKIEQDIEEYGFNDSNSEDIRALLVAQLVNERLNQKDYVNNLNDNYKYFYLKTYFYKIFFIIIYTLIIIFEKPDWCSKNENLIKNDCSKNINGDISYNLAINIFIPAKILNNFIIGIMFILLIFKFLEYFNYKKNTKNNLKRIIILIIISIIYIGFYILKSIIKFYFTLNFIRILFLVVYIESIGDSIKRIYEIIYSSRYLTLLFFINVFLFAAIARALFLGILIY